MVLRTYLVGHYKYNDQRRLVTACVRREDVDSLPPTMYEVVWVHAANKRDAIKLFRANPQYCNHGRK